MIRIGLIISFLIFSCEVTLSLFAQDGDILEYYIMVDILPTFRGSTDYNDFLEYVNSELKYPNEAIQDSFEGRLLVQYVVDSTGAVINPDVPDDVPSYIKEEVTRVLFSSPNWIPGKHEGRNVNVTYTIPITFSLNNADIKLDSMNPIHPMVDRAFT